MKLFAYWGVLLVFAFTGISATPPSENYFVIDGMQVEWAYEGDLLTFKLHSPYQGWLALGFNPANDLINANLVMGAVAEENTRMEEFFVVGFDNQQSITSLGGQPAVQHYLGHEDASGTSFEFTIDTRVTDDFHYDLREGQRVWLICSYSMADDFGHYSIMRRHLEITL
ncbi:MAG: hypothetical protein DA408_20555 [Bacteroidetes bacterium]|nr:MAG: hypothetical protein C7N36_22080 [Bacteroidota bacterium]PTM08423.1 MAG: hypothetical protein DA408_20555 [Bacteroidota bacterium]